MSAQATTNTARHDREAGLTVTAGVADGRWTVRLVGEHDLGSVPILDSGTCEIVAGLPDVVIDLSGATFIDCAILNWLIRTNRTRLQAGLSGLRIVEGAPSGAVARVLDLAGGRTLLEGDRVVVPAGSVAPPDAAVFQRALRTWESEGGSLGPEDRDLEPGSGCGPDRRTRE